jgi:L-threonylcarbamoyladenylate synthase
MRNDPRSTRRLDADAAGIAEAAALLRAGSLVAFPTETVYGLGCDAGDAAAVAALYAAKGRPQFNPLIAHAADAAAAMALGRFDALARRLAARFWPGPLTLVVDAADGAAVCDLARAGLASVALRVPAHPVARALIAAAGRPIVAPSANRSGHVSPTEAAHVLADLDGRIDAVLDGGATPVGIESTILAVADGRAVLLRAGGLPRAAIEAEIGAPLVAADAHESRPAAPGRLASHYAPRAPLRLDAGAVRPGEALLAFGPIPQALARDAVAAETLSASSDLEEAASRLYGALRRLDAAAPAAIAVMPVPGHGLGEAIADRLRRGAAPRTASAPLVRFT